MKNDTNGRSEVGKLGEQIAERFLLKKGYQILNRNYRKLHGEIDIIARERKTLVFVEVKTVTREITESITADRYKPEDRVDRHKMETVERTAKLYMTESNETEDWRIDVLAVELKKSDLVAHVTHYRNAYL
jgi:putative endonuclease